MTRYESAVAAQKALIVRMREVRSTLPKWWNVDRIQAAQAADPECLRLKAEADLLWTLSEVGV